jgi:hypothetical protein
MQMAAVWRKNPKASRQSKDIAMAGIRLKIAAPEEISVDELRQEESNQWMLWKSRYPLQTIHDLRNSME